MHAVDNCNAGPTNETAATRRLGRRRPTTGISTAWPRPRVLDAGASASALLWLLAFVASAGAQQTGANLVNLNEILAHQRALASECRQLEAQKLAELEQLLDFDRGAGAHLLESRVTIKLPAVCLLLVGPPSFAAGSADAGPNDEGLRLDMVNWIYDHDDLLRTAPKMRLEPKSTNGSNNNSSNNTNANVDAGARTKRQAASLLGQLGPSPNAGSLLNDYWFDLNRIDQQPDAGTGTGADADAEQRSEFRRQVEQMIGDERFQQALRLDADKLGAYLSPVVLVPGLAGSRLQARASGTRPRVNIICSRQTGWQDLWLTLRWFLPVAIDCWVDNARLEFDPVSGFAKEPAGVETRVPDFGSVESVRHLDLGSPELTSYFGSIIERYTRLGYQPGKNLFAAPYDFRLAPEQLFGERYFGPLRQLIEFAYANAAQTPMGSMSRPGAAAGLAGRPEAQGQRVTLVCHSMGCTNLLVFLRRQSAAWRQSRIKKLIAISSPWGGSIKALKAMLVGEQFGLPIISELKMRKLARTFPSVAYLLPQAVVFERPDKNQVEFRGQVLVQTSERSFLVGQLEELLRAAGLERQWVWFNRSASLVEPLSPLPDLNVDCIHSLNIPTPETIVFRNASDFPDGAYELVQGDGDGTVNHQSLLVCGLWAAEIPHRVRHKVIMNTSHLGVLSHPEILAHITDDVVSNSNAIS